MTTNDVRPLSLYQSGVEGVYAQATLHLATKPTANDTVTIGGVVYTFKVAATLLGDVAIGAAVTNSQANLKAAVNGDTLNPANPFVTMATFATNNGVVTARVAGTVGNTITTTASLAAGAPDQWDAATLGTTRAGSLAAGTAVPATSRLVAHTDFDAEDALERTPYALGLAWANRGYEDVVVRGTKFTIPDYPFNFEQVPMFGLWGVTGGVKPTGTAAPVTWVFTPSGVAHPGYQTRTIERRLTDGAHPLDDEWAFAVLESFNLKWQQRKNATWGFAGFARARADSTLTPTLLPPSPLTQCPAGHISVFVDDSWGAIGGTQKLGAIITGEHQYNTGMKPADTSDGRATLDFPDVEFDPEARTFTLKLRTYVKDAAFAIAERAKAEAAANRFVRLALADAVTGQSLHIDMVLKHTGASQVQKMVDVDGQEAVDLEFTQTTDDPSNPASAHVYSITAVTNGLGDI